MSDEKNEEFRILIVDDTINNIRVLVPIFLREKSFRVNVASNGREALEVLEKITPDLILLDVMMPELDGFETCEIIKNDVRLKDIPVIFLTAKAETEDITKAFNIGASDYITKPFNSVELMARVKTHLTLKRQRDILKRNLDDVIVEHKEEIERENQVKLELREQLLQSQKLEAVGQLASGIAHDFNNQLSGIVGAAELLDMYIKEDKLKKYLKIIQKAATNSANLTRQLLAYARKGKERNAPFNLNDSLAGVTELLKRSIDKRVLISTDFEEDKLIVKGDVSQIENVFINMGVNASHAMEEQGGTLSFATSSVELTKEEAQATLVPEIIAGNYIKIEISDTGSGMSQEIQERIFEPFFTTKEIGKGTGMGLAAAYGCVKNHQGCILVDSKVGEGTKFTILLPAFKGEEKQELKHGEVKPVRENAKILIIDDEEIVCDVARDILESVGYKVVTYQNPIEGVSYYERNHPVIDLVIIDKIMPEMNGLEVYLNLKKVNPEVACMLASGYSNEQTQDVLDAGVKSFLQKPYTVSELLKNVNGVLA